MHHVASVYPIEIQPASLLAGQPLTAATWDAVARMKHDHAKGPGGVTKAAALAPLAANSAAAAAAIGALSDEQLDRAAVVKPRDTIRLDPVSECPRS